MGEHLQPGWLTGGNSIRPAAVQACGLNTMRTHGTLAGKALLACLVLLCCAFMRSGPPPPLATRALGFSLNANPQGRLYTLFMYTVYEGRVVDSRPMHQRPFVLQASGLEESPANLESIDLFSEYGIKDCGAWNEDGRLETRLDCSVINDLWKLRFRGAVVEGAGSGWAGEEFTPSPRQQILLQTYRAADQPHWQGPYVGADAFRLLRDMQDPDWVRTYRDGG